MKNDRKTAKEIFLVYKALYNGLLNIYCQAKDQHPFESFPDVEREIWKAGLCVEIWHTIALTNAKQKHYRGG